MPSASDEDRLVMMERFGSIDSNGPERFLKSKGWVLTSDWRWLKTGINDKAALMTIPDDEWACIVFLQDEWDYGGVRYAANDNKRS